MTQIVLVSSALAASVPSRARPDAKAISVPRGDQAGLMQSALWVVILVKGDRPVPSSFTIQMLPAAVASPALLASSGALGKKTILSIPSGLAVGLDWGELPLANRTNRIARIAERGAQLRTQVRKFGIPMASCSTASILKT